MGQLLALVRAPLQRAGTEEASQVQFPPRSGCYFGSYFIMGGEHFNTGRTDTYLFGEANDLTFLNRRPASFPYPAPAASEPSKTLQSLVNVRRDSVKLVKLPDQDYKYSLEFVLDTDVACAVRVLTSAKEEALIAAIRDSTSKSWRYPAGIGLCFKQPELLFTPIEFSQSMFKWGSPSEPFPLIIHIEVEGEFQNHSHTVFCVFEKSSDSTHATCATYSLKVLKQKQNIDGISFILQEIYGMESKGNSDKSVGNGECVVCLNAPRDTMILPCRHLCLCYTCAEDVRFKSNTCLMCRQPFRALLRIEALQRIVTDESDGRTESDERYERVDLVQYSSSRDSRSRVESEDFAMSELPRDDNSIHALDVESVAVENVAVENVAVENVAALESVAVESSDREDEIEAAETDRFLS